MNYYTIAPPTHLSAFVRCYWVFEGTATAAVPYVYRGYADGCPELVFFVKGGFDDINACDILTPSPTAHLHSQSGTFSRAVTTGDFSIFGCYLYPYVLPLLFGFPATDFTGRAVEFRAFASADSDELTSRIITAKSAFERAELASAYLTERLMKYDNRLSLITNVINHLVNDRSMSIDAMAAQTGLSIRQFERRFKEFCGFTPKHYSRVMRFQRSLKYLGSHRSLSDIALDCEYYDQAHFSNDFKEFSGLTPKEFFGGNAEGSEYRDSL